MCATAQGPNRQGARPKEDAGSKSTRSDCRIGDWSWAVAHAGHFAVAWKGIPCFRRRRTLVHTGSLRCETIRLRTRGNLTDDVLRLSGRRWHGRAFVGHGLADSGADQLASGAARRHDCAGWWAGWRHLSGRYRPRRQWPAKIARSRCAPPTKRGMLGKWCSLVAGPHHCPIVARPTMRPRMRRWWASRSMRHGS